MFASASNLIESLTPDSIFPKEARLRRRSDFQRVYDQGFRVSGPFFTGICFRAEGQVRGRVGFAVSKAVGGSVIRNRVKRRLREAVRPSLGLLGPQWNVVIQARLAVVKAPFASLKREVERLFSRCGPS